MSERCFRGLLIFAEGVSHVRDVYYWRSLGYRQLAADTFYPLSKIFLAGSGKAVRPRSRRQATE